MRERLADRVYYGWVVVGACFAGSGIIYGLSYSFGVFFDPLLVDFQGSRGGTSLVFALHTFVLYIGAVVIGGLVDRYGTRTMMAVGAVLLGAGLLWASRAGSFLELVVAYAGLASVGLSVIYVVSYATVPQWFERRRGVAAGLASAGLGLGMFVVPPVAEFLVVAEGWRFAYAAFGVALGGVALAAALLFADDPASLGVAHEDRVGPAGADQANAAVDGGTADAEADAAGGIATALSLFRDRAFRLVFVGWVLTYVTLFVVFPNLPVYATDVGLSRGLGAVAIAVAGGSSVVARVGVGYVGDRVGRVHLFVACSALMGVATLGLPAATTPASLGAFALVFGVGYGGNGALISPLTADLFGTAGLNTSFGLMSTSFAVSGLLAPYAANVTYDLVGSYTPAFLAAGVLGVLGAALVAVAGRLKGHV